MNIIMLEQLLAILKLDLKAEDFHALTYDFELVTSSDGREILFQFDYFTIETTFGECFEIHRNTDGFLPLYDLFQAEITALCKKHSGSVQLYPNTL